MNRTVAILFRLALWCLLTADLRPVNLAIGLAVAWLLPSHHGHRQLPPQQLAMAVGRALLGLPKAYGEAFRMMGSPHPRGELVEIPAQMPVGAGQQRRSPALLVFLEILRINITPLTLVLGISRDGRHYRVHQLFRQSPSAPRESQER